MSFGNRLHNAAIRGCLITALVFAPYCLDAQDKPHQQGQASPTEQTQQSPTQVAPAASIDGKETIKADWDKLECSKPKSHDEADLCEQRRMAEAAERTVRLNWFQVGLGVVGFLVLAWTLFYVRKSTIATAEAARATTVAAEAARKSAAITASVERPYVYISDIELKEIPFPEGKGPPGKTYVPVFIFTNYGRTPAFVTRVGYKHAIVDKLPDVPVYKFTDNLTVELVIRPGESYPFTLEQPWMIITKEDRQRSWQGKAFPRFWGQIRYRDFLGGVAETGFVAFQYPDMRLPPRQDELAGGDFRFTGPPAYTYHRYREDGSDPS